MTVAALTYTYNEAVNLPLWIRYYGQNFGEEHLYVADRGSTDESLKHIGNANLIRLPRNDFDEFEKTGFLNNLHAALLNFYDAVIVTDCDEFLVPDPQKFTDLKAYVERVEPVGQRAIGIDVIQLITAELPLDPSQPILAQRKYGRFHSPECKGLISGLPIRWLPGFHSSDREPIFDPELFLFHLKLMDFGAAVSRQIINMNTTWSKESLEQNLGAHHRWDMKTFVHQSFLVPVDLYNRGSISDFIFEDEIAQIREKAKMHNGSYYIPMNISKFVRIPDRFAACL